MSARYIRSFASAIVLCAVLSVRIASAQTQPQNGNMQYPTTAAPAMPQQNGFPSAAQPAAPFDSGYRASYFPEMYGSYSSGFPVFEVRAVPVAWAQKAVVSAQFRRSQSNLELLVLEMKKAFERTRDWVKAIEEEREAWDAVELARKDALRSVMNDSAYQACVSLRDSLAEQVEQARQDKSITPDVILSMAQVKMGYSATASAMEHAALTASPEFQQARERLRRSAARLGDLRLQFDLSVRNSPDVLAARQTMNDLRIAKVGAEVFLDKLIDARGIALWYALWYNEYRALQFANYGAFGWNSAPLYTPFRVGYPIGWWPQPWGMQN